MLRKLVGYFVGSINEDDVDEDFMKRRSNFSSTSLDDFEVTVKTESKEFDGVVTSVHGSYGLINGEVYAHQSCFPEGKMPQVKDRVNVKATREGGYGGWRATRVIISATNEADWDEISPAESGASQQPIATAAFRSVNESDDDEPTVAMVTSVSGDKASLNNGLNFNFSEITCEYYKPQKRDWVSIKILTDSDMKQRVTEVKPLRTREFDCEVVAVALETHGYIEGDIFYTNDACEEGFVPKRGQRVRGLALESEQGKCSWRAFFLAPALQKIPFLTSRAPTTHSPMLLSNTVQLLSDKEGIVITPQSLDFGKVQMDSTRSLLFTLRNNENKERTLRKCSARSTSSQFEVSSISLVNSQQLVRSVCVGRGRGRGKNRELREMQTQVKLPVNIPPQGLLMISISCKACQLGQDKEMFIMDFGSFKIARYMEASVYDNSQVALAPSQPYQRRLGVRDSATNTTGNWLIPGQKPTRSSSSLKLPNRLAMFPVPDGLMECVMSDGATGLVDYLPCLTQPLCMENYADRFSALLHLEEIQQHQDIREFDLDCVPLRRFGEFLTLEVPGLAEGRPSLLIGDRVIVSNPGVCYEGPQYEGFIHEVLKDEVLLKFHDDFHDSCRDEGYNVRFTFSRTSYRRCHQAAKFAQNLGEEVLFPTRLVSKASQILPRKSSGIEINRVVRAPQARPGQLHSSSSKHISSVSSSPTMGWINPQLNARQQVAVHRIMGGHCRPTPYILFGPPGTGKTITVVEAILQVFLKLPSSRILACTPSNSAADLIAERLHLTGKVQRCDMVRLNAFQRTEQSVVPTILPYCNDGSDLEKVARYRIIVSTCASSGSLYALNFKPGHYTHAFIDEAGQATEPECLIPVGLVTCHPEGQVVLAGDPMQLGPVLSSRYAKHHGLKLSFLERLIQIPLYARDEQKFAGHGSYDPFLVTKLVENYRSHPALLTVASRLFYHDELKVSADKTVIECMCQWEKLAHHQGFPFIFHGLRGEDLREGNSPSWFNPMEALQVMRYLQALITNTCHPLTWDDIGIITPYRKQVEKIRLLIDRLGLDKVKVGSVEEFQGQERLVIIISTVRSCESLIGSDVRHNLGFLTNPKRFNVSITRAQALLVVIGNPHILVQDEYWQELIQYCVNHRGYIGCDLPHSISIPGDPAVDPPLVDTDIEAHQSVKPAGASPTMPSKEDDSVQNSSGDNSSGELSHRVLGADETSHGVCESLSGTDAGSPSVIEVSPDICETSETCETSPDTCETSPDTCETSSDTCETSPDIFETSTDTCETSHDTCETPPDICETSSDTCETSPDICETPPDIRETSPDTCETSPDTCETSPDICETPPDICETPPDICETSPNTCETSPDIFETSHDACETSPDICGTSPDTCETSFGATETSPDTNEVLSDTNEALLSANEISQGTNETPHGANEKLPDTNELVPDTTDTSASIHAKSTGTNTTAHSTYVASPASSGVLYGSNEPHVSSEASVASTDPLVDGEKVAIHGFLSDHNDSPSGNREATASLNDLSPQSTQPLSDTRGTEDIPQAPGSPRGNVTTVHPSCTENHRLAYAVSQDAHVLWQSDISQSTSVLASDIQSYIQETVDVSSEQDISMGVLDDNGKLRATAVLDDSRPTNTLPNPTTTRGDLVNNIQRGSLQVIMKSDPHNCTSDQRPALLTDKQPFTRSSGTSHQQSRTLLSRENVTLSDQEKMIIKQMEYYFGDFNLMKDEFLLNEMAKNLDHWVPLSLLLSFNRMKSLSTSPEEVCMALRNSSLGIVECHKDNQAVRRSPQKPLITDHSAWKVDLAGRSVVVEQPRRSNLGEMQKFFQHYGPLEHLEMNIMRCKTGNRRQANELMLVIFFDQHSAQRVANVRPLRHKHYKLFSFIRCPLVEECVKYMYERRIENRHPQPVGQKPHVQKAAHKKDVQEMLCMSENLEYKPMNKSGQETVSVHPFVARGFRNKQSEGQYANADDNHVTGGKTLSTEKPLQAAKTPLSHRIPAADAMSKSDAPCNRNQVSLTSGGQARKPMPVGRGYRRGVSVASCRETSQSNSPTPIQVPATAHQHKVRGSYNDPRHGDVASSPLLHDSCKEGWWQPALSTPSPDRLPGHTPQTSPPRLPSWHISTGLQLNTTTYAEYPDLLTSCNPPQSVTNYEAILTCNEMYDPTEKKFAGIADGINKTSRLPAVAEAQYLPDQDVVSHEGQDWEEMDGSYRAALEQLEGDVIVESSEYEDDSD